MPNRNPEHLSVDSYASLVGESLLPEDAVNIVRYDSYEKFSPAEEFAELVGEIRKRGDGLDSVRRSYDLRNGYAVPATFGAAWGDIIATELNANRSLISISSMLIPIAGMGAYSLIAQQKRSKTLDRLSGVDVSQRLGQKLEVFNIIDDKTGSNEIVMRWCGPIATTNEDDKAIPPAHASESLTLIADLARNNNIKTVLIEPDLLQGSGKDIRSFAEAEVDTRQWLKRKKQFPVEFLHSDKSSAEHTLLAFTPDKLRVAAQEIGHQPHQIKSLKGIIDTLREYAPEHSLVRIYDRDGRHPTVLMPAIAKSARHCLERNLSEVGVMRDNVLGVPTRDKVHKRGKIREQTVDWQIQGKTDGMSGLERALSLDTDQLVAILEHPELYQTQQIITATEYAAYLFANQDIDYQSEEVQEAEIVPDMRLQTEAWRSAVYLESRQIKPGNEASAVDVTSVKRRVAHLALVTTVFLGGAGAAVGVDKVLHDMQDGIMKSAENNVAHNQGIDPSTLSESEKAKIDTKAISQNSLFNKYAEFTGIQRRAVEVIDLQPAANENTPALYNPLTRATGLSQGTSSVGNLQDGGGAPKVEWELKSNGGMRTDGYWADDVGNTLSLTGQWTGDSVVDGRFVEWSKIPTSLPRGQKDYIKISGVVPAIPKAARTAWVGDSSAVVRLPVLDGTAPIAGEFAGEPINLFKRTNGTYAAVLDNAGLAKAHHNSTITYYVVKAPVSSPHATVHNALAGVPPKSRIAAENEWKKQRAESAVSSYKDHLDADVAIIRNNFRYSFAPLSKPITEIVKTSSTGWANFVDVQSARQQANCNVASTLVALDNQRVNVAWGYLNNSDTSLMSSEAHMWNVDAIGTKYDATPTKMEVNHDAETNTSNDNNMSGLLMIGGLSLAAGIGYNRRRQVVHIVGKAERRIAGKLLDRYSADELVLAKKVADTATYAPKFDALRIRVNHASDGEVRETRDVALAKLTKHQVHSDHVRDSLQRRRELSNDKAERRLLRFAERIIQTVHRAGLAQSLKPEDDISGLL